MKTTISTAHIDVVEMGIYCVSVTGRAHMRSPDAIRKDEGLA